MNRIRKNDTVYVISGKDKGKKGRVLILNFEKGRAVVEGISYVKKAAKRTREDQAGGIITKESSINLSNLALFCSRCSMPTRVGYVIQGDATKARVCKKCKEPL